jgi:hypothetical protein
MRAPNELETTEQRPTPGPVFADDSGRRQRRFRISAGVVACACLAYALVALIGLTGHGPLGDIRLPVVGEHATATGDDSQPAGPRPGAESTPLGHAGSNPPSSASDAADGASGAVPAVTGGSGSSTTPGATDPSTPIDGPDVVVNPPTDNPVVTDPGADPSTPPTTVTDGNGNSVTAPGQDPNGAGNSENALSQNKPLEPGNNGKKA